MTLATDSRVSFFCARIETSTNGGRETGANAHRADAPIREGNADMKIDMRREQLEQLAEDGDEAAVGDLYREYEVDLGRGSI